MSIANFKNRIVSINRYPTPGAWDNFALPEYSYSAVVVKEDLTIDCVPAGNDEPQVDATPELMAVYEAYLAAREAERQANARERELNTPRIGRTMEVLKGKNKGFQGIVKWVGASRFGESALLINEAGVKVFTKPSNVKFIAEALPQPKIEQGTNVRVKMGKHAGKTGKVEWMGDTRFGYKAKVETQDGAVWANPKNLEVA